MADIRSKISEIYSLEQLAAGRSSVHGVHPFAKLAGTVVFLLCVISFDRFAFGRLVPYIFYPVILMSLAEIPYWMILKRTLVALPFCLFAGLSNLLLDRAALYHIGTLAISGGFLSFATILFRTLLCVSAVLILVAVTPFSELTAQLRRLHIPGLFIMLFEMTYRYIGVLLEETASMYTAYRLRSTTARGLEMRHMGSFVGQLLLRSFDRAERIYNAMKCRGYALRSTPPQHRALAKADFVYLFCTCALPLLFRLVNVPALFSAWLGGLL